MKRLNDEDIEVHGPCRPDVAGAFGRAHVASHSRCHTGAWTVKHSTDRILTTHAGSLSRPASLIAMGRARAAGESKDDAAFAQVLAAAVSDVVRKQRELGIDI